MVVTIAQQVTLSSVIVGVGLALGILLLGSLYTGVGQAGTRLLLSTVMGITLVLSLVLGGEYAKALLAVLVVGLVVLSRSYVLNHEK